jgi:hypothetical protein
MVYQYRYIMTLMNVFAHTSILRRKRRGIQPQGIQRKYSVFEAICFLKSKSDIKIFNLHHELKRLYGVDILLAKAFCVSTICLDGEHWMKFSISVNPHRLTLWAFCKYINQFYLWRRATCLCPWCCANY